MKLRVSATDLDQLRYFRSSDMELSDLLARLRRETEPTEAMAAGIAFHTILENADVGELTEVTQDGYTFRFDLDAEIALPRIRELKLEKVYRVDGIDVTLVGKVDALSGLTVYDHKTTSRFDAENYADAIQWRAYLDMFGARKFIYNVFEVAEKDGIRIVRDFHELPLYHYPALHSDVMESLSDFVGFAREHLSERLMEAA